MSTEYLALIAALGTPIGFIIIYLFNRRATLRNMDAVSDATIVASAGEVVKMLQIQIRIQEDKIEDLNARLTASEAARVLSHKQCTEQLDLAHEENQRTSLIIAQLRNDLDVTSQQVVLLRSNLLGDSQTHPPDPL